MDRAYRLWHLTFLVFVAATLSFMAAMSIASALFVASSAYLLIYSQKMLGAANAVPGREFLQFKAYWLGTFLLIATAGVSWLAAWLNPPLGMQIQGIPEAKKFLYFVMPLLIAWAITVIRRRDKIAVESQVFWRVLLAATIVVSLVAFFQFWSVDILGREFVEHSGHFLRLEAQGNHAHGQGFMGFHLSFASAMCFSFAYLLGKFLWVDPQRETKAFCLFGLAALLTGIAVYYSYSRIAIPALAAAAVALAILRKPRWGLGAVFLVAAIFALLWSFSPDLRGRILDRPGWTERAQLYQNAWTMFRDRPWTGVGFCKTGFFADAYAERLMGVNTAFGSHAHNNFLEALASTGIPGFFAYLIWWGSFFLYAFRSYRDAAFAEKWLPAALIAAGLAFQVNGLTQVNFYDAKSQYALVLWGGIVLALEWRRRETTAQVFNSKSGILG